MLPPWLTVPPGGLEARDDDTWLSTLLGSCVAVCLYDPKRGVGGLNHFLRPAGNGEDAGSLGYGDVALPALIEAVRRLGGRDLRAKVFGGGRMYPGRGDSGARNAAWTRTALREAGIPIEGEDLGGDAPRRVAFHPRTGRAYLFRLPPLVSTGRRSTATELIALGASTGGTEALEAVLQGWPGDLPPVVIAQHIPAGFSESFAQRLDRTSALSVHEARDGEPLVDGAAYVAPGNYHLEVRRSGGALIARVRQTAKVGRHRPSVDVLFRSVAQVVGRRAVAALLTGMGADGAAGLGQLRNAGAYTVAQDEETSVVWGMPGEAVARGAAIDVLPLSEVGPALLARGAQTTP